MPSEACPSCSPETVVDFARRLGFSSPIPPFLSVALGSNEATLQEVTSAYSVFPNRGSVLESGEWVMSTFRCAANVAER